MKNLTKDELEALILEKQYKDLNRPFWKKPSYLAIILPFIMACGGLSIAYKTGLFDATSQRIRAQELNLEMDIKELKSVKNELQIEKQDYISQIDSLARKVTNVTAIQKELINQKTTLSKLHKETINQSSQEISKLKNEKRKLARNLKKKDTELTQYKYKEVEKMNRTINDLIEEINKKKEAVKKRHVFNISSEKK